MEIELLLPQERAAHSPLPHVHDRSEDTKYFATSSIHDVLRGLSYF